MRKAFILIYVLLFSVRLHAQGNVDYIIHINQLPPEGILLDKGWKFQGVDNPAYADPRYDDSRWQPVDPTKDIHDIPQLREGKIGWFRLKLQTDSAVLSQPLALIIQQSGASEIYVNGKPLHRFGVLSIDAAKITAYDPLGKPVPFRFTQPGENVVAVRYALQPGLFYNHTLGRRNRSLSVTVNRTEAATEFYQREKTRAAVSNFFRIGAFISLLILHMAFYVYYPTQKANLYFSLFALFVLVTEIAQLTATNEVKNIYDHFTVEIIFAGIGILFLQTALYFLLNQKRGGYIGA